METIRQQINIPENHNINLRLHVSDSIPVGEAELFVIIQPIIEREKKVENNDPKEESIFGIWENREITAKTLRNKAWGK